MKKLATTLFAIAVLAGVLSLNAQDKFTVVVTNDTGMPRPSETIVIPFKEVRDRIPGALLDCIAVRGPYGDIIPSQVTNFTPEARPVLGDDLLWQYNFALGDKAVTFTVERTAKPLPPFPQKTFARYIPERLDDFAWENDVIGHRMYGPRLDSEAAGKSRMISSGIDVWVKNVRYPIIDRWYLKGHDAYHVDSGEGLDMYDVGTNRGAGGTGVWGFDGSGEGKHKLYPSKNWSSWKILANGPIRTVFELTYDTWDAQGLKIAETKRFTVDAGHNLDQVDSTFTFEFGAGRFTGLPIAIGLSKPPRNATYTTGSSERWRWISNWATYDFPPRKDAPSENHGSIGIAALIPDSVGETFGEDAGNNYILAKAVPSNPVRYYIGACWDRDGTNRFPNKDAWEEYLSNIAFRLQNPLKIEFPSAAEAAK